MRKLIYLAGLWLACNPVSAATITVGAWNPIFKGVELASGQQVAVNSGEVNHQVRCLRVDLTDPDVQLLTTPHPANCTLETGSESTGYFLQANGLQAAINGGFYSSSSGPSDTTQGTAEDVYGLAIARGVTVSPADNASYRACMLFTSNNAAYFVPANYPATNTDGIYTAISGNYVLLLNGVNQRTATPNDLDPRTAVGLSADRRYLFLMTIDGRQTGWSDGADFYNAGEWLKRFGASDGINVDGGGSTTMVTADALGQPVMVNRSSFYAAYGRLRNIGHNFGVAAKSLPSYLNNLTVEPGGTTALVSWQTDDRMTTKVEYGLTSSYGSASTLDARLLKRHAAVLTGLAQGSNYYFRAISSANSLSYTQASMFTTLSSLVKTQVFGITNAWRYTANNLDGVAWKATNYSDSTWSGPGPGLLYVENSASVSPKNTMLASYGSTIARTYYFRTRFKFSGDATGVTMTLSNYVDDGAVFYLNGTEVYRLRMAASPTVITNGSSATGVPAAGTAQQGDAVTSSPDVFTLSGTLLTTNLVQGTNVLAVEVHNQGSLTSGDIVFGSALILGVPATTKPRLNLWSESGLSTLFWNSEGFTLQQSTNFATWTDVTATQNPFPVPEANAVFYRLMK